MKRMLMTSSDHRERQIQEVTASEAETVRIITYRKREKYQTQTMKHKQKVGQVHNAQPVARRCGGRAVVSDPPIAHDSSREKIRH